MPAVIQRMISLWSGIDIATWIRQSTDSRTKNPVTRERKKRTPQRSHVVVVWRDAGRGPYYLTIEYLIGTSYSVIVVMIRTSEGALGVEPKPKLTGGSTGVRVPN